MQMPHNLCLLIACMHLKSSQHCSRLPKCVPAAPFYSASAAFLQLFCLSDAFQQKDAPASPLFCGNAGASSLAVLYHAGSQLSAWHGTA